MPKNCWREILAITRRSFCFVDSAMSGIANSLTYLNLAFIGNDVTDLSLNVSIALKNLLEGNMGNQEKLCLFSLSSYV